MIKSRVKIEGGFLAEASVLFKSMNYDEYHIFNEPTNEDGTGGDQVVQPVMSVVMGAFSSQAEAELGSQSASQLILRFRGDMLKNFVENKAPLKMRVYRLLKLLQKALVKDKEGRYSWDFADKYLGELLQPSAPIFGEWLEHSTDEMTEEETSEADKVSLGMRLKG